MSFVRRFMRAGALVAVVLLCTVPDAAGQGADAGSVLERLDRSRERLGAARAREGVLTAEVKRYGDRVRALEGRLSPLRARSARLESELAAARARLEELTRELADARRRLAAAEDALARRQEVLGVRLREIYARDEPGLLELVLGSGSLSDAVNTLEVLEQIAERDAALADAVSRYADETRAARDEVARARAEAADVEARARVAADEARRAKASLERRQADLAGVLDRRETLLASVRGDRRQLEEETRGLEERSARLAERIRAAQADPPATVAPPPSGGGRFAWPVSGTLTSPFGPRWGRMHEGIDIAGASGTPIHASAAGTVIVAGWSGGYGNLVVVDHGGGFSTAYAHNSTITVSVGQSVSQGTVLAGMGTTGNSTGVHSHFEIRVNGGAVDPLGYL